jgi:rhamnosyltransferase
MTIDVIIFTYKPGNKFLLLMDRLMKQTVMPQQIIIVNTERSLFEGLITEKEFLSKYPGTRMIHLAATEFDHGSSRNLGVSLSQADCFVLMTQDAVPASRNMIDRLTDRLIDGKTAVAYARQRPDRTSDRLERYTRRFNYGSKPLYKTGTDIAKMGIKTYFCSNACAAYNAKIFERLGGFVPQTIFNEDMIYAATAVAAGYAVAYRPEAAVYHAHD